MHLPLWTALLSTTNNGPVLTARADSADICLPIQLQTAVPACALPCLQSFIEVNYKTNICSVTANLNLLCATQTSSGLTIGEGSLLCVISDCAGANVNTQSGYTICQGIPGARPNMAGILTATVSAISTPSSLPTIQPSASITASDTQPGSKSSSASSQAPDKPTSVRPSSTDTSIQASSTRFIRSTTGESSPSTSGSASASRTFVESSTLDQTSTSTATVKSTSTVTTGSMTGTTSGATAIPAAPASQNADKSSLPAAAVAGIATAIVVVLALAAGYLAYLWIVRRKEKQRRRSHRFSTWSSSNTKDDANSRPPAPATITKPVPSLSPRPRFYADEVVAPPKKSLWRGGIQPSSSHRVVGATNQQQIPKSGINELFWPSPTTDARRERWSISSSPVEDRIPQPQDLLILGSPKTRSSARSFSSAGVELPAPLRLSKIHTRNISHENVRIPLTPVYDNGNFETTIRRVFDAPAIPILNTQHPHEQSALNFSRRTPSVTRKSKEETRPLLNMGGQELKQLPTIAPSAIRKPSETSCTSAYTEFEEDPTPENEEIKDLVKAPVTIPVPEKSPLRELQWPQVPRSASIAKHAERTPTQRAAMTIRVVRPDAESTFPPTSYSQRTTTQRTVEARTNTLSADFNSQSSESPVFPMPPVTRHRRATAKTQSELVRNISDSIRTASQTTTATPPSVHDQPSDLRPQRPFMPQPGAMYQQIQRLSTGRPLAQKLQYQNYMPRNPLERPAARAKVTPLYTNNGDLYLSVGQI